jgi:hypothetical protein
VKHQIFRGVLRLALFVVLIIGVVALTVSRISHSWSDRIANPVGQQLTPAGRARVRQLLLDGVGTRVSLPVEGARPGQVSVSIDSVRTFIRERSGLELAPEAIDKLTAMEQRTLDESAGRITCDDLSDTVLAVLVERFRHATDAEIERAAGDLANARALGASGANSPVTVAGSARVGDRRVSTSTGDQVTLRADGRGVMSRSELIDAAKQYRARMNAPAQMIAIIGIVRPLVRQAFRTRLGILSQALPEQWEEAQSRGLTPVHAFLLSYSEASDDALYRSKQGLDTAMKWIEQVNLKSDSNYPASAGRLPYGSSGYLFSSPLDLILDKPTTARLLDRIAERTSK